MSVAGDLDTTDFAAGLDLDAPTPPARQHERYVLLLEQRPHPVKPRIPIFVGFVRRQGWPRNEWIFATFAESDGEVIRDVRAWVAWRGGRLAC